MTTSTDDELASRMFGATTRTAPAPETAQTEAASDEELARAFYPDKAPAPQPDRVITDDQAAAALYDNGAMTRQAQSLIERAGVEQGGMQPAEAREVAQEWGTTFAKFQINGSEAETLTQAAVAATFNPPDAVTLDNWAQQAELDLKSEYGPDGWRRALEDARVLVAADPKLGEFLERTGLGNHPAVVRVAVAKARALRAAGRIVTRR